MQDFKIKTEKFEGPLDLLLELVEKKKLHITEISLSEVTDEFIRYIEANQPFPVESASEFLVVASTLLLIKSKALLPYLDLSPEEEEDIEELEVRLKVYKEIKEVGKELEALYGNRVIFPLSPPPRQAFFAPGSGVSMSDMRSAIMTVLNDLPKSEEKPKAHVRKVISLEEMIDRLEKRIRNALSMTFKELVNADKSEKIDVVVGFLALLELVKQGMMNVRQDSRFGDIHIENQNIGTPRYGN